MIVSVCVLVVFVLCSGEVYGDQKTVSASAGSIIGFSGFSNFDGRGKGKKVWKYLGIPYAQPPVGERRFRKPVPLANFQILFKAFKFGPACPQNRIMASMWIPGDTNYSEDCLTLNIFVPEVASPIGDKLPVMLWIHGGAYAIGQSAIYSGENLAAFGDVIVVTVNYRLGALGFLATHDDDVRGNYGLWDQHLAMQWVHNNIRSFGGNPEEVTLFGESAGAASTVYQAMYPGNRGLMKRIIAESGSANSAWAFQIRDNSARYATLLGKSLGCPDLTNTMAVVTCLREKPFQDIIDHSRVGTLKETLFRSEFAPVVDNEIVFIDPLTAFGPGSYMPRTVRDFFSEIDVITGINKGDGEFITAASLLPYLQNMLTSYPLTSYPSKKPIEILEETIFPLVLSDRLGNTSTTLNKVAVFLYKDWHQSYIQNHTYIHELLDLSSDHFFFIPSLFTARAHAENTNNASTYLFQFSHQSPYTKTSNWIQGAQHGDEIAYVFGFPAGTLKTAMKYPDQVTQQQRTLSTAVMTYWTNFAKTGNPNYPIAVVNSPVWPEYDLERLRFIDFDTNITINNHMYATREAFWLHLARDLQDNVISAGTSTHVIPPLPGIIIG